MDGQGTTWRRNIAENFNRLSRVHQRYRRQTDDRQTTDRRQTDRRWHIANMNLSSRSLKTTAQIFLKFFLPDQTRPRKNWLNYGSPFSICIQIYELFQKDSSTLRDYAFSTIWFIYLEKLIGSLWKIYHRYFFRVWTVQFPANFRSHAVPGCTGSGAARLC